MTVSSISNAVIFRFEECIFFLMQNKKIKISKKIGYALLISFYSLHKIQMEWKQIQHNIIFRKLQNISFLQKFFPLVVYAFRSSFRGGMSFFSRNLNEEKSFYHVYLTTKKQKIAFYVTFFLLFLLFITLWWKRK